MAIEFGNQILIYLIQLVMLPDRGKNGLQIIEDMEEGEDKNNSQFSSSNSMCVENSTHQRKIRMVKLIIVCIIVLAGSVFLAWNIYKLQKKVDQFEVYRHNNDQQMQMLIKLSRKQSLWIKQLYQKNDINWGNSKSKINMLHRNEDGLSIGQVLYPKDEEKKLRLEYHINRETFINSVNLSGLELAKYNMIFDQAYEFEARVQNTRQWQRLDKKYGISKSASQLGMCLIVPGYNNRPNFRIQYNLNSIFTQNYSNYKVVIINDASIDGSGEIYKKYFIFHNISSQRYIYIENQQRLTAVENIYNAVINHCQGIDILITVDADDELIGWNILQTFNAIYQSQKLGFVYSNFYQYQQGRRVVQGFTSSYTEEQIREQSYRSIPMRFSQLRTCKREIFLEINPKDMKNSMGFYKTAYDMVFFLPILQISCGKIKRLDEHHLLYNFDTGINDWMKGGEQRVIDLEIRNKTHYPCSLKYMK